MSQMQPPEVRILKHILSFEDPAERRAQLEEAFVPGPEMATENEDFLSTCVLSRTCPVSRGIFILPRASGRLFGSDRLLSVTAGRRTSFCS